MRKVTTINLNGQAYQLEEPAYDKLQVYLHHAEAALSKNPDKAEVLADIEQAIADKCERWLKDGKNVISVEQITEILDAMGAVEADDDDSATAAETNSPKRLFVVREGAMLMGVCNGIGAYLGIEPNLVRLAFIVLTISTGGFWVLVYVLLGLFLPTAKTDAELAEAHGKPVNAQAIVARARERAPDPESIQRFSTLLVQILRVIARIICLAAAIAFGVLTAIWLWVVWLVVFRQLHFYGQLQGLNGWHEWLAITALYLLAAVPLLLIARLFSRVARNSSQTRLSMISESLLAVLWGGAIVTLLAFGTAYAQNTRDYVNSHHGYLDVGKLHVCVDRSVCHQEDQVPKYFLQEGPNMPMPVKPVPPPYN